jgi:lambda family phage tail tape measure protein
VASEIRRAQMEQLRASQSVAETAGTREEIEHNILDLERVEEQERLALDVKLGERTAAEAEALDAVQNSTYQLQLEALAIEERKRQQEEQLKITSDQSELKIELLELESALATTAAEQREVELRILDEAIKQERIALEATKNSADASAADKAYAEARLAALNQIKSGRAAVIRQNTMGPLESYLDSLPNTAAEANEALENVAVNGLQSLEDGLVDILTGTENVAEAFRKMAASIIADLIRIQIQKMIMNVAGSLLGGGSGSIVPPGFGGGFASGGFTGMGGRNRVAGIVHGQEFVLNADAVRRLGVPNLDALNRGAPLSAVEPGNDNSGRMMGGPITVNVSGPMSDKQARRTGMQVGASIKQELGRSARVGF